MWNLRALPILIFTATVAVALTTAAENQISIFPSAGKEYEHLNLSGISPRDGRRVYIPLPFIPTLAQPVCGDTAIIGACDNSVNLTSACQCGIAVCGVGQYCTDTAMSSLCNVPILCTPDAVTDAPCACPTRTNVCDIGSICTATDNMCVNTTCLDGELIVDTGPCVCGTTAVCDNGQVCTLATSTCSALPPTAAPCVDQTLLTAPCLCGDPAAAPPLCRTGQRCTGTAGVPANTCTPSVCPTFDENMQCLCGTDLCDMSLGQSCDMATLTCAPKNCIASKLPVSVPCICYRDTTPCRAGMVCSGQMETCINAP